MNLISLLRKTYLAAAFATGIALLVFMLNRPGMEGDTFELVKNAYAIPGCLAAHRWMGCTEGGQYPLFQVAPSFLFALLGFSQGFTVHFLAYLSAVMFALSLWLSYRLISRKDERVARLAVLVLCSGYSLRYLNSSFGEMLAASEILIAVAVILSDLSLGLTFLALFCAGLTKETAPPFIGLLGVTALWVRGRIRIKDVAAITGTAASALAANLLFNIFRFGTIFNPGYTGADYFVPGLSAQLQQMLNAWIDPRLGMFPYWPMFGFCLVLCGVVAFSRPFRERVTFVAVMLALIGLTFGFGKLKFYYGPVAWGDRYMVPWLPVSVLILLFQYAAEVRTRFLDRAEAMRPLYATVGGLLAFLSLPQFRVLFRHQWVDLIADQTELSVFSMLAPGKWLGEWAGALLLSSLLFYSWMRWMPIQRKRTSAQR